MIYTVGHKESYEKYFKEDKDPQKLGSEDLEGYIGGSVWLTKDDAKNNCPPEYNVYGVEADWDKDTTLNEGESHRNLRVTSSLVQLNDL
jgi:hypothetical protein